MHAASDVSALFAKTFGGQPRVVASAPGRVNLIGEHTDYNGGEVLPIGIAQRTWVALGRASNGTQSRAVSANSERIGEWDAHAPRAIGEWWDYVSGVSLLLSEHGVPLQPLDVAVVSNVPSGAGLSSSAAIEVAAALALASLAGVALTPQDAALLCQRAEREFVGVACGLMDQFASAMAQHSHALHIDCATGQTDQIPMREAVLIFDTGVARALRNSEYNTRRAECDAALALLRRGVPSLSSLAHATVDQVYEAKLPAILERRALHVAEETQRVRRAVNALRDIGAIPGNLLYESHESLRSLYECSAPELDWFVERASEARGVTGARLTGAGWGGCAIAVGEVDALGELAARVNAEYQTSFGHASRTWITCAEGGARIDSAVT